VSEIVRLTLVSHAMTDAMAAGRFPADEPLSEIGQRQTQAMPDLGSVDTAVCGPELRTIQTAERLGLRPRREPMLADLACGRWRGQLLGDIGPADLAVWLTDPNGAPHGGESVAALIGRVRAWLDSLAGHPERIVAVTHPGVIRAAVVVALDAPPTSFWRIDVGPASRTVMHLRAGAWTLRSTG